MKRFRKWLRDNKITILQERSIAGDRVAFLLQLPDGSEIGLAVNSDAADNPIEVLKPFLVGTKH